MLIIGFKHSLGLATADCSDYSFLDASLFLPLDDVHVKITTSIVLAMKSFNAILLLIFYPSLLLNISDLINDKEIMLAERDFQWEVVLMKNHLPMHMVHEQ